MKKKILILGGGYSKERLISIRSAKAIIKTIDKTYNLLGAEVMATDIRASFSLIIAAMMSKGKTVINRIYHLDRGYEDFDLKLKKCGVNISRKK